MTAPVASTLTMRDPNGAAWVIAPSDRPDEWRVEVFRDGVTVGLFRTIARAVDWMVDEVRPPAEGDA